jgi:hypothetical protein
MLSPSPPTSSRSTGDLGTHQVSRGRFLWATASGVVASIYWAVLTLLTGVAALAGERVPATELLIAGALTGVYTWDSYRIFKGNPRAVFQLFVLHIIGGLVAFQKMMASLHGPIGTEATLLKIKIAIAVFGVTTTYLAHRSLAQTPIVRRA